MNPAEPEPMPRTPVPPENWSRTGFVVSAVGFEVSLGLLGLVLAWLFQHDIWRLSETGSRSNVSAAALGCLAALPLFALLVALQWRTPPALRRFTDDFRQHVLPMFLPLSILEMALLSFAAGVGEEMLFRGFLQAFVADLGGGHLGTAFGLVAASLLFGVCHWLNATYAVITTAVGLYFGLLLIATEHLLVPIAAHAFYDFAALVYLTRWCRSAGSSIPD